MCLITSILCILYAYIFYGFLFIVLYLFGDRGHRPMSINIIISISNSLPLSPNLPCYSVFLLVCLLVDVCVCVCVCVCVRERECVCVCRRWWHIHIYQFIPYYASVYTQTHTRILKPFEDREPTGPKVDNARYWQRGGLGWRAGKAGINTKLKSCTVSLHINMENDTLSILSTISSRENASLNSVDATVCVCWISTAKNGLTTWAYV